MKYSMDCLVANNQKNSAMEQVDMRHKSKIFISGIQRVFFDTTTKVDRKYIMNIIDESRKNKDAWIPAIRFCEELYVSPEITEISDGENIIFITPEEAK